MSSPLVAELLDALKALPSAGVGVLLIMVLAEVVEVAVEGGMELVAPTGNVRVHRGWDRDCRAHIDTYWRNVLPASDIRPGIDRRDHDSLTSSLRS